ncbi:MAG: hypothetical protein ACYC1M_16665 [Armatimonadota bacterium]
MSKQSSMRYLFLGLLLISTFNVLSISKINHTAFAAGSRTMATNEAKVPVDDKQWQQYYDKSLETCTNAMVPNADIRRERERGLGWLIARSFVDFIAILTVVAICMHKGIEANVEFKVTDWMKMVGLLLLIDITLRTVLSVYVIKIWEPAQVRSLCEDYMQLRKQNAVKVRDINLLQYDANSFKHWYDDSKPK